MFYTRNSPRANTAERYIGYIQLLQTKYFTLEQRRAIITREPRVTLLAPPRHKQATPAAEMTGEHGRNLSPCRLRRRPHHGGGGRVCLCQTSPKAGGEAPSVNLHPRTQWEHPAYITHCRYI